MKSIRAFAAVCAVLLVAACTPATTSVQGSASPPPSDPAMAAPSGSAPAVGSGGGGATSAPDARPPATAPTAKPGITVPRAGRYTYDVVEESRDAAGPTKGTYTQQAEIDEPVPNDDGVTVEIRTTRDGSDSVEGEVYLFREGAIDVLFADGCALDRAAPHYRLPLRADATWRSPRTCEGQTDVATTTVRAEERMRVGGVEVRVFPVVRTAKIHGGTRTKTQWYAPTYHLVVRSRIEESHGDIPHTIDQTLRSLTPA